MDFRSHSLNNRDSSRALSSSHSEPTFCNTNFDVVDYLFSERWAIIQEFLTARFAKEICFYLKNNLSIALIKAANDTTDFYLFSVKKQSTNALVPEITQNHHEEIARNKSSKDTEGFSVNIDSKNFINLVYGPYTEFNIKEELTYLEKDYDNFPQINKTVHHLSEHLHCSSDEFTYEFCCKGGILSSQVCDSYLYIPEGAIPENEKYLIKGRVHLSYDEFSGCIPEFKFNNMYFIAPILEYSIDENKPLQRPAKVVIITSVALPTDATEMECLFSKLHVYLKCGDQVFEVRRLSEKDKPVTREPWFLIENGSLCLFTYHFSAILCTLCGDSHEEDIRCMRGILLGRLFPRDSDTLGLHVQFYLQFCRAVDLTPECREVAREQLCRENKFVLDQLDINVLPLTLCDNHVINLRLRINDNWILIPQSGDARNDGQEWHQEGNEITYKRSIHKFLKCLRYCCTPCRVISVEFNGCSAHLYGQLDISMKDLGKQHDDFNMALQFAKSSDSFVDTFKDWQRAMKSCWTSLVNDIIISSLIAFLFEHGLIEDSLYDSYITDEKPHDTKHKQLLLHQIYKQDIEKFSSFVKCLVMSEHSHLAKTLIDKLRLVWLNKTGIGLSENFDNIKLNEARKMFYEHEKLHFLWRNDVKLADVFIIDDEKLMNLITTAAKYR